jgi:hypothetical protein
MDRSFRDVGRLRRETVRLLRELALAEMGVAEGGIRMVLWLLVDSMGQEVAIRHLLGHVHKGSVIERMQGGRNDAVATEAKLILGDVAVV